MNVALLFSPYLRVCHTRSYTAGASSW